MSAESDPRRSREVAEKYAAWVRGEMNRKQWDQAMLVRRSGIPKQTVSTIVNGGAPQPTALQIVRLARAFGVSPVDVLRGIGLWMDAPVEWPDLSAYLRGALDLDEDQITAIRRSIDAFEAERKLGEIVQHFDDMEHRLAEDPTPEEAEERSRRVQHLQAEDRDPIDEEPLAADTGEDLRRAQKRQRQRDSRGGEIH